VIVPGPRGSGLWQFQSGTVDKTLYSIIFMTYKEKTNLKKQMVKQRGGCNNPSTTPLDLFLYDRLNVIPIEHSLTILITIILLIVQMN